MNYFLLCVSVCTVYIVLNVLLNNYQYQYLNQYKCDILIEIKVFKCILFINDNFDYFYYF